MTDPHHPLFGQRLKLLSLACSRGPAFIAVALPDGRRRLIRRAATDLEQRDPPVGHHAEHLAEPAVPLGALGDVQRVDGYAGPQRLDDRVAPGELVLPRAVDGGVDDLVPAAAGCRRRGGAGRARGGRLRGVRARSATGAPGSSSRIRPSYRMPSFCSTRAEAALRGSQVANTRCRPCSPNARPIIRRAAAVARPRPHRPG